MLLTTAEPVSDAYGNEFSLEDAGAGRLNIGRAYKATLVIQPPDFVGYLSSDKQTWEQALELKSLVGDLENIKVGFEGPEVIQFSQFLEGNILKIKLKIVGGNYGDYEGRIIVNQNDDKYAIPFLLHYTQGSITAFQEKGKLNFNVFYPDEWTFAKISVTNSKNDQTEITSSTPSHPAMMNVYENGLYWIEGKIRVGEESFDAFDIIQVDSVLPGTSVPFEFFNLPEKQIGIIVAMMGIVGLIGIKFSRSKSKII